MDKTKRRNLIKDYLQKAIDIKEFNEVIGIDLEAMTDPVLGAIHTDLAVQRDEESLKREIIEFDKAQEEEIESLGKDYIENKKRNLTLEVGRYKGLIADSDVMGILDKWGTKDGIKVFEEKSEKEFKNASYENLLEHLQKNSDFKQEIFELIIEISREKGLSDELKEFAKELLKSDDKSIKDEIGEEFKPKTQGEQNQEQEIETEWQNQFQSWERDALTLPNGAKKKQEVTKEISDLIKERDKDREQSQEQNEEQER